MMILAQSVPVPRDLQLPLPLPESVLAVLLVVSFLLHILFVNLTVGSSLLTTIFEWLGHVRGEERYDKLSLRIADTITVNKSAAVVLGIGPLLCINLLYTVQFYSANTLTGHAWVLIVPLVSAAFLLGYLHKYTWYRWKTGPRKIWHLLLGSSVALLFLFIPLIFLSNVNLMLFPDRWAEVRGFFSSLLIGNVFPRYCHFLCATVALTGLFFAGWFGRSSFPLAKLEGFNHGDLMRLCYRIAFFATLAQFIVGPVLLFTLPSIGLSKELYFFILGGAVLGFFVVYLISRQMNKEKVHIGKSYLFICLVFSAIVLSMGTGRHLYREGALADQKALIKQRTLAYEAHLKDFSDQVASGRIQMTPTGERLFLSCASCHATDKVLAGPSLVEIAQIYKNNPDGIVAWAMAPGRKRPGMAPMPSFSALGPDKLKMIATYMLEVGSQKKQ
jgi:cytochrome c